jgi:UDP-glucose 4-epimerase
VIEGKRALVTGGAGTIGSHVVDLLVDQGAAEVVVLDNFVRGRRENLAGAIAGGNVRVIDGDIRDVATVRAATAGVDLVFHLAALRITQCAEQPRLANEVLVDGTFNVLEAAVEANVQKVVASSSASVYGLAEEFPTTERHHPYDNDTFYGAAKAFNEGMLRSFHAMYGLDYVALRYFNVYGPRQSLSNPYTGACAIFSSRLLNGKPPLIFEDGRQARDFVHVRDIVRANLLALEHDTVDYEAVNIGTGEPTSILDLAQVLAKLLGVDIDPELVGQYREGDIRHCIADISLARDGLGFTPGLAVADGLADLVDWAREQHAVDDVARATSELADRGLVR